MYRSCDKLRDKLQRQIVLCVLETFCENLCLSDRILSPQQLARIQSDLLLCDSLRRQNSVAETDFRKNSPVDTKRFATAKCCCNVLPSEFRSLQQEPVI